MNTKIFTILMLFTCVGIFVVVKEPVLVKYQASIAVDRCGDGDVSEVSSKGYKCKISDQKTVY